jgi:hypothetical protein
MRLVVLMAALAGLGAAAEPGQYSAQAFSIANQYEEGQTRRLASPDGRKELVVKYLPRGEPGGHLAQVSLLVQGREVRTDLGRRPLCEALWSPDSRALAMTCSQGGTVGKYDVTLYRFGRQGLRVTRLPKTAESRYARWKPRCFEPEAPNVGAITFRGRASRIVVAVQVPPHSNCDSLGTFRAYEMTVPGGRIVREWQQMDAKKDFAGETCSELKAAEDECIRNPRQCWIPGLHGGKQ